jgi:hypothetical protein
MPRRFHEKTAILQIRNRRSPVRFRRVAYVFRSRKSAESKASSRAGNRATHGSGSLMPTWPSPTRRVPTGRRNLTVGCSLSIRHRAELSIGEVRAEDRFFLRRLEHGRISSRSSVDIPPWKGSCGTSRANTVRRRREDETPPGSFSSSIGRAAPAGRRSSARIRAQIRPELDLEVWDEQMLLSLLRSQFGIHLDALTRRS